MSFLVRFQKKILLSKRKKINQPKELNIEAPIWENSIAVYNEINAGDEF